MTRAPARRERTVDDVLAGIEAGDVRALARALSWVDDFDPRGAAVLSRVHGRAGRARVLGITGPPGAGKSTLVDKLAAELVDRGRRVAVVAVDPSSAFSGGAILGDRIRMHRAAELPGVYIRSMATRGHLGGLARATEDTVDVLDAFGFDDVLIETVGVGQDEIEVVQVAHVSLVVLVPYLGDDVQAIKAGIMEIADAFVINKADRDGVERLESALRSLMQLTEGTPDDIPVLRTVATTGEGVAEVADTLANLWDGARDGHEARRRERVRARLTHVLRDALVEEFLGRPGSATAFGAAVEDVLARRRDPYRAAGDLLGAAPVLDHVGVAVEDLDEALAFWRDAAGLAEVHRETVESEAVTVAMLPVGDARLELLEPTGAGGAVRGFLDRRGPGVHHVCLRVRDIASALQGLREAGARIVGAAPRRGAEGKLVAFVHPKSATGVLLELSQDAPEEGT